MDKFNVIEPTDNLDELNNDMVSWTRLPFKMRFRSDEECIRRYNMTNIDLYNKIKAAIISAQVPEDKDILINSIKEDTLMKDPKSNNTLEVDFAIDSDEEFENKIKYAEQLELSPNIVLIHPFRGNRISYSIQDLNNKYNKFLLLTPRNKRFSNSYSISLWGYNVQNMYNIIRGKLCNDNADILSESFVEKNLKPISEQMDNIIINNDTLSFASYKLDSFDEEININSRNMYNYILEKSENEMEYDFDQVLPKVVPYFTYDELNNYCPDNNLGDINPEEYSSLLFKTIKAYETDKSLEEEVLKLGWNPSVKLTEKSINIARKRQIKWLNEHAPKIINIENIKTKSILENSIRSIYRENNLYPIFIVISYSNTLFGKIIRKVKGSEYTHAGISLDSNLNQIMTYKREKSYNGYTIEKANGFYYESLDTYINNSKDCIIKLLCIFVDLETRQKIESNLKIFLKNQEKTKYSISNLFNILKNKEKENDPENLALVCSQFVDTVLKLSDINLFDKSSNLVIPQDFAYLSTKQKVYQIYSGKGIKYNAKEADDKIYSLMQLYQRGELLYSDTVKLAEEFYVEAWCYITENEEANKYIEKMYNYLLPEASISESYAINEKDIYYNKDKFDSGEINLCFITGHSGSGKSTMGRDMQNKDNIEHYELDDIMFIKDHFTMDELKEYGDLIYSYFKGPGKKFYITYDELVKDKVPPSEYEDVIMINFCDYCKSYAKSHKDKKFVIEGIWLFGGNFDNNVNWFEPSYFKDYAFYIKGTSMIISNIRASKRDASDASNKKEYKLAIVNQIRNKKRWKYYFINEKKIKVFRDYFKKLV